MKITFLYPPLEDPTMPYHAAAYLRGHLRHNGFQDAGVRDINVEFIHYCLDEHRIVAFQEEAQRRLSHYERQARLSAYEQLDYLALWGHRHMEAPELQRAIQQLRRPEGFQDYISYASCVKRLNQYFGILGGMSFPAAIVNCRQVSRMNYSIYHLDDLFSTELADRACYPFVQFFYDVLARDAELLASDCLGISVTYDHQMLYAVWMAKEIKQRWPDKLVLLGGTAVSQFYKYMKDKSQMSRFSQVCDAVIVGEGETAICEIADRAGALGDGNIPNTITFSPGTSKALLPQRIHYENVAALGAPVYDCDWQLYLSPARGVNYAPTRGCYWNRCTFCDYGLNSDRPTSPWRERKIEQVIADLKQAVQQNQIEYVYFAVDVMSPSYLDRLSDALAEARLGIRWSAELRMEKAFSPERCRKMARAGCVCASFGMESGNQRILDLIDKGTRVSYMAETMKNFAQAGIAVQIMAFTDFPTETSAEKAATFEFLDNNREYWSAGGIGTFVLTGGAILAKNPERLGLTLLEMKNVDIARSIQYQVPEGAPDKFMLTEEFDESFDNRRDLFPAVLSRPWAGGTDTLHSMIFYSRHGRDVFKEGDLRPAVRPTDTGFLNCTISVHGTLKSSLFNISALIATRREHKKHAKGLLARQSEPTFAEFDRWLSQAQPYVEAERDECFWIANDQRCMKLESDLLQVLEAASRQSLTVRDLLAGVSPDQRDRILIYLESLASAGLISCQQPDRAKRDWPLEAALAS